MMNTTKEINRLLHSYKNGNTKVNIFEDGTKERIYTSDLTEIDFPESIDVKITNYCDMNCLYCHEISTKEGVSGDLNDLFNVLEDLPSGVELAIGGGNPLSHPDLVNFLQRAKNKGFICNITINQGHLSTYFSLIKILIEDSLVKGVGISIVNSNYKYVKKVKELSSNVVYHVIAGVNDISVMDDLISLGDCKVLILGYKVFGLGKDYYNSSVYNKIVVWNKKLPSYIGKCLISFDNLAIEQLNVRSLFTDKGWEKFYMGDDFCYTMYIDAVKRTYSPTSRSNDRKSFDEYKLTEYFKKFRNK